MTELVKGEVYTAHLVRNGTSSRGAWEMITVTDERHKNDVVIFPRNCPSGVKEGKKFNLVEIVQIRNGMRKDKNDKWQHNVTCEAIVQPIESEFDTGLAGQSDVPWDEMASDAGNPWDDLEGLPL